MNPHALTPSSLSSMPLPPIVAREAAHAAAHAPATEDRIEERLPFSVRVVSLATPPMGRAPAPISARFRRVRAVVLSKVCGAMAQSSSGRT